MLRIVLVFGVLSGVVIIAGMLVTLGLTNGEGHNSSLWLGYLIMILALSMIFFGVKRYRDRELGGIIKFLPAFGIGLAIAIVASIAYVLTWESYLAISHYDFMTAYSKSVIEAKRAEGITGPALDAVVAQMETLKVQYANPLFRLPMTFLEIFPVGLIMALISAAVLRNSKILPDRS